MAEDLSDVTVRTIKQIQPIVTPLSPAFGQPEIIWEKIWENGQKQLLRKTHNHYDPRGYLCQQDHYDANEEQRYSLYFSHDAAGRLLEKTDALGRKTRHNYRSRTLAVALNTPPIPGTAHRLNKNERWPVYVNKNQGWVCIGCPKIVDKQLIEFAPNCIAAMKGQEVMAIWLHPLNLPK